MMLQKSFRSRLSRLRMLVWPPALRSKLRPLRLPGVAGSASKQSCLESMKQPSTDSKKQPSTDSKCMEFLSAKKSSEKP